MATAVIEKPETNLVPAVTANPGVVLMDREKFNAWYDKLRAEAPQDVDVSTKKGRDELRSYAATVRSEKAAIDKARLRLTKEWRDMTAQANVAGKEIEEKLESLAVEVRAPLTAWEEIEEARVAECQRVVAYLRQAASVAYDETAADVRARLSEVEAMAFEPLAFNGYMPQVQALRDTAVEALTTAATRMEREEAERVELERLRAAQAEREAREAAEREAAEAAAAAEAQRVAYVESIFQHIRDVGMGMIGGQTYPYIILIRELEEKVPPEITDEVFRERAQDARDLVAATLEKLNDAQARQAERAQREAAEEARKEAEQAAAQREQDKEREHAEEVARIKREAEEAQRKRDAEDAARAAEARRVEAEQARLAEENRKLEANKAHRNRIKSAAKDALITCGADEETARKIVLAIIAGEIPAVSITFGLDRQ